jgi:hypothetical protein
MFVVISLKAACLVGYYRTNTPATTAAVSDLILL